MCLGFEAQIKQNGRVHFDTALQTERGVKQNSGYHLINLKMGEKVFEIFFKTQHKTFFFSICRSFCLVYTNNFSKLKKQKHFTKNICF